MMPRRNHGVVRAESFRVWGVGLGLAGVLACHAVGHAAQTIPVDRTFGAAWQNAGYPGAIPSPATIVNVRDFGAAGNGTANDAPAAAAAINSLNGAAGVVYFPAGTYLLQSTVYVPAGVVLRGERSQNTTLRADHLGSVLYIASTQSATFQPVISGYTIHSSSIVVTDGSVFSAGDYAEIREDNDANWGVTFEAKLVGQLLRITAVAGNTLTLERPLRLNYLTGQNPEIRKITPITEVGVENLKVERLLAGTDPVQRDNVYTIDFEYAARCWVRGVEAYNTFGGHVALVHATAIDVTGCYIHHAHEYDGGGSGYGVRLEFKTGECRIENNIFQHLRHSMLLQAAPNGNVFGYNYSREPTRTEFPTDGAGDIVCHGNYPYANLAEGNICQHISVDSSHGANGPLNTFFRNRAEYYGFNMTDSLGHRQNVVGNETFTGPWSAFLGDGYALTGTNRFEYGNNTKSDGLQPAGTGDLADYSYYLNADPSQAPPTPAWWTIADAIPTVGVPKSLNPAKNIPAWTRYFAGAPFTVGPPSLSRQPTNQVVNVGQTAAFTVQATGTPVARYAWYKSAVALAGQTNAALSVANAQPSDAGSYDVLISDDYGSVRSAAASLTVNGTPAALQVLPVSRDFGSLVSGASTQLSFTVSNTGDATLAGTATVSAPFSIVSGSPYSVGGGGSTAVVVGFAPTSGGAFTNHVAFTSNGGVSTNPVSGLGLISGAGASTVLVASNAVWNYLDNGTDPDPAWRGPGYDDAAWASGPAPLGYGDTWIVTTNSYGPDSNNRYVTTYYRRSFNVADPAAYATLRLRLNRDDGAVVYLNGTEVRRDLMPSGAIGYTTLATGTVSGAAESAFFETSVSPSALVAGGNVIAVEIHQVAVNSSDLSFALELIGAEVGVRKGPCLVYPGTNTQMQVLWQTDATPTQQAYVEWGPSPGFGSSSGNLTESGSGTDQHQFSYVLTGLTPGAAYSYRVVVDYHVHDGSFVAAPANTATAVTFYGFGDTRTYPDRMAGVTAAMLRDVNSNPGQRQTVALQVGDWVEFGGTETSWQDEFFSRDYAANLDWMTHTAVMGCRGNHDLAGGNTLLPKYWPYNDTNGYYSFDYGPVHITVIDQYTGYTNGTAQFTWMTNDMARASKPFKVALFHQPAFSAGGGHANDTTAQAVICPVLQQRGYQVAVVGHNHYYAHCFTNGVHHVTAGGGGAPLATPDQNAPALVMAESTYQYVRFDISNAVMTVTAIRTNDTVIESFPVYQIPRAGFTASPTSGEAPLTVTFADASTGMITNWFWDFGDGTSSTNASPVHVYASAGSYPVSLTVSGPAGSDTLSQAGYIAVSAPPPPQLAVTPAGRDFGTVEAGQTSNQTFRAVNLGGQTLIGTAALLTAGGPFALGAGTPYSVAPGTTNLVTVSFSPGTAGTFTNDVVFSSNGGTSTNRVTGTGQLPGPIIVDNTDVTGVAIVGPWLVVNGTPGFYGPNCLNDGNLNKGAMSVRFTPNLPAGGQWQVYLRWAAGSNRASNVPVDIVSSNGSVRVTVNEQVNGGQWNLLGTYSFVAGTNGNVTVRNDGTDGYVIADAVEFVYGGAAPAPPAAPTNLTATAVSSSAINLAWADTATNEETYMVERSGDGVSYQTVATLGSNVTGYADSALAASTLYYYRVRAYNTAGGYSGYSNVAQATTTGGATTLIVDNADASGVVIVGPWLVVNGTPGFYGPNCLNDGNLNKGAMSVRFTPNLPAGGQWQVYLRWAAGSNRASNVPVDIVSSNGSVRVTVNEQVNGGQWNLLGTYSFVAGTNGNVTVRNDGTDGYVIADAVEFVYGGTAPAPPAAPTNLTATAVSSSAINLAWADNATNEETYVVERSGDGVSYQSVATLGSNVTAYGDSGLTASTMYYYRVRAYNAAGGYSGYSNVAQATTTGAVTTLIVDNADASGVVIVGPWLVVNGTPGFYGPNCLNDGNLNKGSMSVRFTPNLPVGGPWQVYLRWAASANRASNVPVDIVSSNGSVRVTVNEQVNGGQWNLLGTYSFVAGTNGNVTMRNDGTDGYVIADAVEFVYGGTAPAPPAAPTNLTATAVSSSAINLAWADTATNEETYVVERSGDGVSYQSVATLGSNVTAYGDSGLAASTVYYYRVRAYNTAGGYSGYSNVAQATTTGGATTLIVDNADASGVVIVGPWLVVNGTPGFYGPNCLNDGNLNKGQMSVRFTPNLPAGGQWQVYLRWAAGSNRASNVPVDIVSSNGSVRVTVNEQVNGGQWNLLGTYSFVAGTNGNVTMRNDGTDGYVIADAVEFVYGGTAPAPPAAPTNLTATAVSSSAINLAWADNATNEETYVVERSGDGVSYQSVATLGSNVTGYADSGLTASTVYYYRVRAYNAAGGYSGYSNVAQATTPAGSAEIIVDNADASGVVIVGPWLVVNGTPGFYGPNCLNDGNLNKGSMSVRFTPVLPVGGQWQVYLRWAAAANRASNVPVDIVSSNGSVRVTVNEQVNGGQWNLLGTYSFVAGTNGNVTVRNDGTDGYVIADAVRFVPSGSGLAAGGTASTVAATGAIADVGLSGVSIGTGSSGSSRILADGSWEITGSGSGFGVTDSLYYDQQTYTGDFTVMARIESLTSDGAFPQAGLMIREGLAEDARLVSVAATWTNQYWAARHTLAGTVLEESALGSTYVYPDAWVALARTGDTVTIYTSSDGQTWVEEQTVTVPALATSVNVGLFLSSGTPGVDAQAVITDFAVSPAQSITSHP